MPRGRLFALSILAACAALLTGCFDMFPPVGCPRLISGPTYPNEPIESYQAIAVAEFPAKDIQVRTDLQEVMRTTILERLRQSGSFADVIDGSSPAAERPALQLAGQYIGYSLLGREIYSDTTPFAAAEFTLQDHLGRTLATFGVIACGSTGSHSAGDPLFEDAGQQAAAFVVEYVRGGRPSQ